MLTHHLKCQASNQPSYIKSPNTLETSWDMICQNLKEHPGFQYYYIQKKKAPQKLHSPQNKPKSLRFQSIILQWYTQYSARHYQTWYAKISKSIPAFQTTIPKTSVFICISKNRHHRLRNPQTKPNQNEEPNQSSFTETLP